MDPDKKTRLHEKFIEQLDLQNSEVWAKIILDDDESAHDISEGDVILFSLINRKMLEVDKEFYKAVVEGQPYEKYYVPYVYGFMVKVNKRNQKDIRKLSKFSDKYIKCKLVDNKYSYENSLANDDQSLRGFTFFAASPFIYDSKKLLISSTDDYEFFDEINDWESKDKERYVDILRIMTILNINKLNQYIPSSNLRGSIKVYNVGQAACNYLVSHSHKIMLDIGVDKNFLYKQAANEKAPEAVKNNYQSIQRCQPEVVILSHWDADHILGVCLFDREPPKLWIAPDIFERKNISVGTARLYYYLCYQHRLLSVSKEHNGQCFYNSDYLSMYKGKSKGNKNNNHGIIVVFGNNIYNAEKVIFPGDCEYTAWPDEIKIDQNFYSVLIVPHHGAKMALKDSTMGQQDFRKRTAIFSYGVGNQYGHPSGEHVLKLKNRYGYEVLGTAEYNYIEILLNPQDDIKFLVIPHPRTTME